MKLFNDYRKEVIDAYNAKKAAGQVPLGLIEPTPAGLRDECLDRYKEAHSQKDEESLKIFFGSKGDAADYHRLIETTDIDKFRPLVNFLDNLCINTRNKNIELLAYLIDFEPRPFRFRYGKPEVTLPPPPDPEPTSKPIVKPIQSGTDGENAVPDLSHTKDKEAVEPTAVFPKTIWMFAGWTPAVLSIVVAIAAITGIAMTIKPTHMYWTGEAYKRVFPWTALEQAQLVPFNDELFSGFKRITQPDTLKKRDIYDVWYAKVKRDSIEFYTDSAAHPVDTTKTLKPMTEYIWTTWVANKVD